MQPKHNSAFADSATSRSYFIIAQKVSLGEFDRECESVSWRSDLTIRLETQQLVGFAVEQNPAFMTLRASPSLKKVAHNRIGF
jgi:hypothetical protein